MTIIEQAAKRLEELNRAGVDVGAWTEQPRPEGVAAPGVLESAEPGIARFAPAVVEARPQQRLQPQAVAVLDLERLESAGYLSQSGMATPLSEQYRVIKRPLVKNARTPGPEGHRMPLIMVTSALPGEGKTFSAINLAMSIAAEIDLSVLLVDADVARRDAMAQLGVKAEAGLMDLLVDESSRLEDVVLRTNVPKLCVMPAGRRHHLSTEWLASAAMERLLARLATDYPSQVVIFDGPPLLVTSEAKVLASRVGQVLVVVEACRTPRRAVDQVFGLLEQCPVVMSVLNKADRGSSGDAYGYGYGYGNTPG